MVSEREKLIEVLQFALDSDWLGNKADEFMRWITRPGAMDDYIRHRGYYADIYAHNFARAFARSYINTSHPAFLAFDNLWESESLHKLFVEREVHKAAMELLAEAVIQENPIDFFYGKILNAKKHTDKQDQAVSFQR